MNRKSVLSMIFLSVLIGTSSTAVGIASRGFNVAFFGTYASFVPIGINQTLTNLTCGVGEALNFTFVLNSTMKIMIAISPDISLRIAFYVKWDGTAPTLDNYDQGEFPPFGGLASTKVTKSPNTYYFMVYCRDGVGSFNVTLAGYYTIHNTNTSLSYPTIQEAIDANATLDGHTIFVEKGTYCEPVVINKSLSLTGENRTTTIIDGGTNEPSGSIVLVTADNVKISGFTIQHCRAGGNAIWLGGYVNMTFSHNIVTGCNEGVRIFNSSGTVVSDNIVQNCYYNTGVGFDYGSNNTVYRNTIIHNHYGISGGIDCHGNTYSENTIINNDVGFGTTSYDSKFFHNNFVNNGVNVIATSVNQFDEGYPSGGNYWSDYNGTDLHSASYQNETGSDGIGDTEYAIDGNNTDRYPLMGMFYDFNATSEYSVQTICNSSISSFQFNGSSICFNVTGEDGPSGFCRICIPTAVMNATHIFVNGTETSFTLLPCSNDTHSYLYFDYDLNASKVRNRVLLRTTMGDILIELYDDMPITTANFINLTRMGIYDSTIFHRVIENFVIQGGDPTGTGYGDLSISRIPDELPNRHSNVRGSVGMAKTIEPNSATSQFYINLVNSTYLDPTYVVFGQVIEGMDVVDMISKVQTDASDRPLQNVTVFKAELIQYSTLEVVIIPEFPSFLILPLFIMATLLAVIVYKKKAY